METAPRRVSRIPGEGLLAGIVPRPVRQLLSYSQPTMGRQPMPIFWIVVQIAIIVCVLISAVIVVIKL